MAGCSTCANGSAAKRFNAYWSGIKCFKKQKHKWWQFWLDYGAFTYMDGRDCTIYEKGAEE